MKQNRIKNITIHTIPIANEKKVDIEQSLSRIYIRYTSKVLDSMNLSGKQKADILREIISLR